MINITFSKFVKMNGRLWEVNFRKLSRGNYTFYADTATLQGERIQFQMEKQDTGNWKISGNQLPEWISTSCAAIGASIDLGMKELYPQLFAPPAASASA